MNSGHIMLVCTVMLGLTAIPPTLWAAESDQGRTYFLRYCASCHGVEGKGAGTVSRSLMIKQRT
jgi:mono/diheme cytochrome c family protein